MKIEPIIYCKYRAREKSIVMAAVEQSETTVAICLKNSHTIISKKQFAADYQVVDKPADGLSYEAHVLQPPKVAAKVEVPKPAVAPVTLKPSTIKDK